MAYKTVEVDIDLSDFDDDWQEAKDRDILLTALVDDRILYWLRNQDCPDFVRSWVWEKFGRVI